MLKLYVKVQYALQSLKDESGQDLIEYALIAALIAVACIAGLGKVATAINAQLTAISTAL